MELLFSLKLWFPVLKIQLFLSNSTFDNRLWSTSISILDTRLQCRFPKYVDFRHIATQSNICPVGGNPPGHMNLRIATSPSHTCIADLVCLHYPHSPSQPLLMHILTCWLISQTSWISYDYVYWLIDWHLHVNYPAVSLETSSIFDYKSYFYFDDFCCCYSNYQLTDHPYDHP